MVSTDDIVRNLEPDPDDDPWVNGPPADAPVVLVESNPRWPDRFAEVETRLRGALGSDALAIDHIGSTSVPGLAAKDVIDISVTVRDPATEQSYVPALEALGFVLSIREPSWYEHRCLRLDAPPVNLHVFGPDCPEVIRQRMFRDWLTAHPDDRVRYEAAKYAAIPGGGHVMDYNRRKQDIIRDIQDRMFRDAGLL